MVRDVADRARPRGRADARARPLAAARDLPRVRAARPAAAAGGGARRGRVGRDPAPGGRDAPARVAVRKGGAGRPRRALTGAELALVGDRARDARGRAARRARPAGASAPTPAAPYALAGEVDGSRRARRRRRRPAGDRARREVARRGAGEPRARHRGRRLPARSGAARLPARRAVRGARHGGRRRRPEAARARARRTSSPAASASRCASAASRTCCTRSSCRSCACCARRRRPASSSTRARLEQAGLRMRADAAELEREIWELAGEEFMIGSPQQLAEVLFVKLGLSRKRRGKTGFSTDARVLQAIRDEHPIVEKIERWRELTKLVQTYLEQLPGRDRRRRPPAHDAAADEHGDGPARLDQPEPAEHPDPHRDRARDPRLLHRRAGQRADLRRLLAGRAARARAHRRRGGAQGHLPPRRGRPHRDGRRGLRHAARRSSTVAMRSKAKMVNYGIVYGLSAYGLADRLRIPQEEAQEFIDRYLERFPAVARVHGRRGHAGRGARLRLDAVRPPPPDPRDPRAQLADAQARRAARGQHDHPGHRGRHHQGRDGALPRRARRGRARDAHDPADPRRAAVRGPRGRGRARGRDRRRPRWSAPPTSTRRSPSTPGIGPNWLAAK